MTITEFTDSLRQANPPAVNTFLQALWYEAKGDWEKAHILVQDIETTDGSWIHAYLHRKEGDLGNASYWYNRAKRSMPSASLRDEWIKIAEEFLSR